VKEKYIPLSVPNLRGNELDYVTDAIRSEWVSTSGKFISEFEESIAKYVNVERAVACQSGTAGLHLALICCGVETGDEVIAPCLTFIAAVNPIKYVNANPVFMDCDDTLNIDCDKLEEFLSNKCHFVEGKVINKKTGAHIKAIIVVHVFGNIAKMEKIMKIATTYNLKVIEDATEALGSYYTKGIYKGCYAGTIGDIGVYSFNGNKIITTGGGGMIVSKNLNHLSRVKYLSTQAKDDEVYFIHGDVGYNYRMTNLQGALGLAQLEKLEDFIQTKKENYDQYKRELEEVESLRLMDFEASTRPNYWFYSLVLDSDSIKKVSVGNFIEKMVEYGIQTRPVWGLIHEQKPYLDCQAYKIEKAIYYRDRIVNIPCSSNLKVTDVQRVAKAVKAVFGR